MDANSKKAMKARIKRVLEHLEKNNFSAAFVYNKEEALTLIKTIVKEGSYTASGGSMTLKETGIMDYLLTSTDYHKEYRDAYNAEFYISSANAITEHGEIYQVDGTSNRISALAYGPENVIIVAGINKIVPDLRSAVQRVKVHAAPPNAIRLCRETPCAHSGECASPVMDERHLGVLGCNCEERICCNTLIMGHQRIKGRITVIIIGEEYGY